MNARVACIQINSGSDIAANITRIDALVGQAAAEGAGLVALPENCFQMEEPGQGRARMLYTEKTHPGMQAAADIAKKYKVWLLVGSLALKIDESGKTVNRQLLLDDGGKIVCRYDKIHLFDVELPSGETYAESARFIAGQRLALADTPFGRIGMSVCYDVRFPHLYRALAKAGAEILVIPAAFTAFTGEAHWHVLLRARAIENGCFVLAPAQVGSHPGNRKTFGHALMVDPWGEVLADAGRKEGVISAELDLSQVAQVRARIPSLKHDRPFE